MSKPTTAAGIKAEAELLAAILALVEEEVANNPVTYNAERPYQSYERIGFKGMRWSVEKRIREYGLEQFFNPDHAILDIGSNFGFFVVEFALHCRLAHGVEPNPFLNRIGELTASYLGVREKVAYFDRKLAEFENPIPYDTVFSLAAFYTGDGRERSTADFYFSKVNGMLAVGGRLFYESTSFSRDKDSEGYEGFPACQAAMDAIGTRLELLREWETPSGSPGYRRHFAIARKKT